MEIGTVVGGRYRIEAARAGRVWLAEDTVSGRPVAVKVPAGAPGPAVRLRHPAIATVLDVGEHEGKPFLAMELLDGYTLDDHLLDGWYRPAAVADFGAQAAEALVVAHRAGTTHGRIEPAHLLLTPTGAVKVLGFGTVTPVGDSSDLAALGTTMQELLGPLAAAGSPGELGALMSRLREDSGREPDPRLTEEFAARLRRLADELAEAEPVAQPPRPVAARRFWIDRRPERLPVGRALAALILAGLVAVTAYAVAVTV